MYNDFYHNENIQQEPDYRRMPPKKMGTGWVIGIIVTVCMLGMLSIICGAVALRCYFRSIHRLPGTSEKIVEQEPEQMPDEYDTDPQIPLPHHGMEEPEDADTHEFWEELLTKYDEKDNPFLDKDYISHMGTNHTNHKREEFSNAYYEQICDSIDEEVPYTIHRDYYCYVSEDNTEQVHISCISLEGDVPNVELLNQSIYDKTMFLAKLYFMNFGGYPSESGIDIMVDSYVTYNDESTLSIVLDEYYQMENRSSIDLYCINIDLDTGIVLNNGKILKLDEGFAQEFREKSNRQNGENTALNEMNLSDVLYYLEDEYNNIIFYTPIGLELGLNYSYNGSSGWITVSYPEYRQYINSL